MRNIVNTDQKRLTGRPEAGITDINPQRCSTSDEQMRHIPAQQH